MSQKGLTLMPVTTAVVPRDAPAFSIETVTDYRSFLDLRSTWNDLATAAGIDHPFLSFEWVQTWWECFGRGNALFVVVVKDRSGPIGIAPLMLSHGRMYGLRVRQLESIGNLHTRRFGFIIARAWREAYRAIWAHVREQRARWDVLRLCQLPEDSQTLAEVRSLAAADGYLTGTWRSDDSPYVSLAGTWETYAKGLDAKHRSNLRNRLKRLGGLGEVGLETVSTAAQVQAALDDGMRLEAAAWKGDAGTSINSQPEIRLFYTRFAERAARGGWLRLNFLTIDGCRIAFHYSVRCANKLYLLKPGYDPRYARYSPSNLLCFHVLQDGFQDGLVEYDFLGASDPWKLDWTKETRPHHWLYVFSDALRGRLLYQAKFHLIPRVKRMLALDKH
jgi:CelD/BcsL family acetyltransferase involved in cellulose biosynthesis